MKGLPKPSLQFARTADLPTRLLSGVSVARDVISGFACCSLPDRVTVWYGFPCASVAAPHTAFRCARRIPIAEMTAATTSEISTLGSWSHDRLEVDQSLELPYLKILTTNKSRCATDICPNSVRWYQQHDWMGCEAVLAIIIPPVVRHISFIR